MHDIDYRLSILLISTFSMHSIKYVNTKYSLCTKCIASWNFKRFMHSTKPHHPLFLLRNIKKAKQVKTLGRPERKKAYQCFLSFIHPSFKVYFYPVSILTSFVDSFTFPRNVYTNVIYIISSKTSLESNLLLTFASPEI